MGDPRTTAVDVREVTREFPADFERRTLYRVVRDLVTGVRYRRARRAALRGVTFTAGPGDKIAVIGNNGAGKSTLLKVIAGLLRPTAGTVSVRGDMVLLTALGVGMIDEVTVADNAILYGTLYGVEPRKMRAEMDDSLAWAGISGYEHGLLKTLSLGMRARLAFSVVRHVSTDIFLIDEALSAGDITFRAKCRAFFDEPRNAERTFLMATHDLEFAASFCSTALWLHEGRMMALGDSHTVVSAYIEAQANGAPRDARTAAKA